MRPIPAAQIEVLYTRIRGFVGKRVQNQADADELAQDIFLKMGESLGGLKDDEKLLPWLYRIARNRVIDYYRKKKPVVVPADAVPAEFEEDDHARREIATCLQSFMAAMDDADRKILTLIDFENKTQKEAGEELGLTLPAAKSRHQRAKQKLREKLGNCCQYVFDGRGKILDYEIKDSDC